METGSASATVKVKCPSCAKLFAVRRTDVPQGRPQFKCNQCSSQFWFQAPVPAEVSEVQAYLLDEEAAPIAPENPQPELKTQTNVEAPPQSSGEKSQVKEPPPPSDESTGEDLDNATSAALAANMNTDTEGLGFGGIGLEKDNESEEEESESSPPPQPEKQASEESKTQTTSQAEPSPPANPSAKKIEQPAPKPAPSNDPLFPRYLVQHPGAEFPCPNCKKPNKKGFPECMYCGIIFEKFLRKQEKEKELSERQASNPEAKQETASAKSVMTPEEAKKKLMQS